MAVRSVGGYQLIRQIGWGGMSTVYEAVNDGGDHVALKLLHPSLAADETLRLRLQREVAVLRRVRSPYVAEVIDAEIEAVEPFIVTELVHGLTLEKDVAKNGIYTEEDLLYLGEQLGQALRAVHQAGVLHRDLKPSNVMIQEKKPILIDFGIAQAENDSRLTQQGMLALTPGYCDPLVLSGAAPNEAADWWALSAVLAFAATGEPPFGVGSSSAVMARVLQGAPNLPDLDPEIAAAFELALARDPRRRISFEQLLEVIRTPDSASLPTLTARDAGMFTGPTLVASSPASSAPAGATQVINAALSGSGGAISGYGEALESRGRGNSDVGTVAPENSDESAAPEAVHEVPYGECYRGKESYGADGENSQKSAHSVYGRYAPGSAEGSTEILLSQRQLNGAAPTVFAQAASGPTPMPTLVAPRSAFLAGSAGEQALSSSAEVRDGAGVAGGASFGTSDAYAEQPLPEWVQLPHSAHLFSLVMWCAIAILGGRLPVFALLIFGLCVWGLDTLGTSMSVVRERRLKAGIPRIADTTVAIVRLPISLLGAALRTGVLFAAVCGAAYGILWLGVQWHMRVVAAQTVDGSVEPSAVVVSPVSAAVAVAAICAVVWLFPSTKRARLGVRYLAGKRAEQRGARWLWIAMAVVVLGVVCGFFAAGEGFNKVNFSPLDSAFSFFIY